jgi:hypothetical protein
MAARREAERPSIWLEVDYQVCSAGAPVSFLHTATCRSLEALPLIVSSCLDLYARRFTYERYLRRSDRSLTFSSSHLNQFATLYRNLESTCQSKGLTAAMLALAIAILATVLLTPFSRAQSDSYTVLSTVIFVRSGDRTPKILGDVPTTLTSLGAQQAYAAGSFYRDRYISSAVSKSGVDKAPLHGLSANSVDPREMYILALDTHPTVATAQAFMQGFYPPLILNESTAGMLDPTSVLANKTYVSLTFSKNADNS